MLLPEFGNPTSATSARSLSSRSSQRSSPASPCSAKAGARRRLLRNRALPRPPRPPARGQPPVARRGQIGEDGAVGPAHHRADGHGHVEGLAPASRGDACPGRACRRSPGDGGGRETRATKPGWSRPRATRRRRHRRRRRRGRRATRGPPGGTTPHRRRRCRPSRGPGLRRRTRTRLRSYGARPRPPG